MKYWVRDTLPAHFCRQNARGREKQEYYYGTKAESPCVTRNGTKPGIWKCRALAITGNKIHQYMQTTMKKPPNNKGRSDRMEAGPSLEAIIQPHGGSFISKPIYLNICETYDTVMGWQDKIPCLFCDLCSCNVWPQKISKYWHKEHGKTNAFKSEHVATCMKLRGRNPGCCWSEGEKAAGKPVCTGGMLATAVVQSLCSSLFWQKLFSRLLMLKKLIPVHRLIPTHLLFISEFFCP